MEGPLTVLDDLSERLHYNLADFPLYTKKDELYRYGYEAVCHWHPDLEFIYIVDGTMDYFINGKIVRMEKGMGIFVNSKRLHYGFSNEKRECTFIALVIHPSLFLNVSHNGQIYMDHKFGSQNIDYVLLDPIIGWHADILNQINKIHNEMYVVQNPLQILSDAIQILASIGDHIEDKEAEQIDNHDQITFLNMTSFIQQHISDKISIDDISKAGMVCRSKACHLFKRYVKESINDYLINYRISKSCELLRDTNLSIIEISNYCGFTTSSYYTSVFKKQKGITPKVYREQLK